MIKTVALEKIFRTEEVETWALNKVNIEVKEGEFVAISEQETEPWRECHQYL